jgi:hypothetical protein
MSTIGPVVTVRRLDAAVSGGRRTSRLRRAEALATPGAKLTQFLRGVDRVPVPVRPDALVVSDNADLYGTLADLRDRARRGNDQRTRHDAATERYDSG